MLEASKGNYGSHPFSLDRRKRYFKKGVKKNRCESGGEYCDKKKRSDSIFEKTLRTRKKAFAGRVEE